MSDRIWDLIDESYGVPEGPERIALLEEVVREADAAGDVEAAFYARKQLMQGAEFGGHPEKALVAFTWCLAQADRDPDRFDVEDVLWEYKWILGTLPEFPEVPRERIFELLDDFERRLRERGYGTGPAEYMRWRTLREMGIEDGLWDAVERWREGGRDRWSDCRACETDQYVRLLASAGRDAEAVKRAKPILQGSMSCAEIPHYTLGHILAPLVRLGRGEDAQAYHERGYRLVARNQEFVEPVADHIVFVTGSGDYARALRLVEKHLPWAVATASPERRARLYEATALAFERAARDGRKPTRKLRLPRSLPIHRDDGEYDLAETAAWFAREAAAIGDGFDSRNGTDLFARRREERRELALA